MLFCHTLNTDNPSLYISLDVQQAPSCCLSFPLGCWILHQVLRCVHLLKDREGCMVVWPVMVVCRVFLVHQLSVQISWDVPNGSYLQLEALNLCILVVGSPSGRYPGSQISKDGGITGNVMCHYIGVKDFFEIWASPTFGVGGDTCHQGSFCGCLQNWWCGHAPSLAEQHKVSASFQVEGEPGVCFNHSRQVLLPRGCYRRRGMWPRMKH